MALKQEDFLYAEHVLRRGFSTEEQVQEGLRLLERLRDEMKLNETLEGILVKKGYLARAQALVVRQAITPERADRPRNAIEGYRLLARVGSGAMGSVYKAHMKRLDIPVALKVLRLDHHRSKTQIERLKREAQLAARLNHVNIVRSLDVGESNGFHYFAMEFVEGTTVREVLNKGPLPTKEALRILREVARALEHAHQKAVVHRDVKPGNIMLAPDGTVKLADFGLARSKGPSELTLDEATIGTPQYLAPEQAQRGSAATPRSDLFSLGASYYHMVTGRPPYAGDNLGEIFHRVLHCDFDPPELHVPDLGLDSLYLIHKLMRANPKERYANATELLEDLHALERGEHIAPPEFRGDYHSYIVRRRRKRMALGAGAAVILVSALAVIWSHLQSFRRDRARQEFCAEARTLGQDDEEGFAKLQTSELLETFRAKAREYGLELEKRGGCDAPDLEPLQRRLELAQKDLEVLVRVERIEDDMRLPGADFRKLHAELEDVDAHYDVTRARAATVRSDIKVESDRESQRVWKLVFGRLDDYASVKDAEAGLDGLANDLTERLLPSDRYSVGYVREQKAELKELARGWQEAEAYDRGFERGMEARDWSIAHDKLQRLLEEKRAVKNAAREAKLLPLFLRLFPDADRRQEELKRAEQLEFLEVRKKVEADLDPDDPLRHAPDDAYRRVQEFWLRASPDVKKEVARLRDRCLEEQRKTVRFQASRIQEITDVFRGMVGRREYSTAHRTIQDDSAQRNWIGQPKKDMDRLLADGRRYGELHRRWLERVRRTKQIRIRRPEDEADVEVRGDIVESVATKPDLYLARIPGAAPLQFRLDQLADGGRGDRGRSQLESILGFDETLPSDTKLRGYFLIAEAFAEHASRRKDPRKTRALYARAASDMANHAWATRIDKEMKVIDGLIARREKTATDAYAKLEEHQAAKRWVLALQTLRQLLNPEGLRHTKFVEDRLEELKSLVQDFVRRAGTRNQALRFGIPARQIEQGEGGGPVAIRLTFDKWYPDEGKVPPNANKAQWLEKTSKQYWRKVFKAWQEVGLVPKDAAFEDFYRRAVHQLLGFREWNYIRPLGGRAAFAMYDRLEDRIHDEEWLWRNWRAWRRTVEEVGAYKELRILSLHNPFDMHREWSIEFSVRWDWENRPDDDDLGPKDPRTGWRAMGEADQGYFCVYAAGVQAGTLNHGLKYGGGSGTALFLHPRIFEPGSGDRSRLVPERQFQPFHYRLVTQRRRRNLAAGKGLTYWHFKSKTHYRVALQRRRDRIEFFAMPLDRWEPKRPNLRTKANLVATLRVRRRVLDKIADEANPDFRFFATTRFHLDDLVIRGTLRTDDERR